MTSGINYEKAESSNVIYHRRGAFVSNRKISKFMFLNEERWSASSLFQSAKHAVKEEGRERGKGKIKILVLAVTYIRRRTDESSCSTKFQSVKTFFLKSEVLNKLKSSKR